MKREKRGILKQFLAAILIVSMVFTLLDMSAISVQAATKVTAKSVNLNYTDYTVKKGKTVKLKATVSPSKAKVKTIIWTTSKKSVVTVNSKGVVKGVKNGTATVTATVKGTKIKKTCTVTVGTPITKVTIKTGSKLNMTIGTSKNLSVSVTPTKASNRKLIYTTSSSKIVSVTSKGKMTAKGIGTATIAVSSSDGSGKKATIKVTVKPILAASVSASLNSSAIVVGGTTTVTAVVKPINTTDKSVTFSSGNTAVATVDKESGLVTGISEGTAQITARTSNNMTGSATITVTKNKVSVTGVKISETSANASWDTNHPLILSAHVEPSNATNQTIKWRSEDESIATVNESTGLVTPKKVGSVKIYAKAEEGEFEQFITITVPEVSATAITVNPTETTLEVGSTTDLAVSFTPAYTTNKSLDWTSSNKNVATVDSNGKVTAVAAGTANIVVALKDNDSIKANCSVTVTQKVTGVSLDAEKTMKAGTKEQLKATVAPSNATNPSITWTSSNTAIATVDNSGFVTASTPGTAVITAKTKDGSFTATCNVTVEAPTLEGVYLDATLKAIAVEETLQLNVSPQPAAAVIDSAQWASSNQDVATVDNSGKVTAVAKGDCDISVTVGTYTAKCTIVVGSVKTVDTFAALTDTLNGATTYDAIIVNSTESGTFEIAAGTYSQTSLIVNAPNATVENHATFKNIEIKAISSNTWIEKTTGNTIDVVAKNTHIIVSEGANASINVSPGVATMTLENKGSITGITIRSSVQMDISGTNSNLIPITAEAADAKITSSIPLTITAKQIIALEVLPGAEGATTILVPDGARMPNITGVGTIPVTNTSDGSTTDVFASFDNSDEGSGSDSANAVVTGVVKDSGNSAVKDAVVYMIPYTLSFDGNQLQAAINAAEVQDICYITTTDANGAYTSPKLSYGNYVLVVKADNKKNFFQTIVVKQNTVVNDSVILTNDTDATGDISGVLRDAATGNPVAAGITLSIRQGANNVTGDSYKTTTTQADGTYEFKNLPTGNYCIQVDDTRDAVENHYVRITFNIIILANTSAQQNMTISTAVSGDQVRFVLSWGAEDKEHNSVPSDLDSHLLGPTDNATRFHVYYSSREYKQDDKKMVDLDVDDTEYEGPETVTVYNKQDGLYHYYVYDYSEQSEKDNMKLATSMASVKIYSGARCVATYNVPYETGTLWDVCTYNSVTNVLTPVNSVYYFEGGSETVGYTDEEIWQQKLNDLIKNIGNRDYGTTCNAIMAQKLQDAKSIPTTASASDLKEAYNKLSGYEQQLLDSTAIYNVTADNVVSWSVSDFDLTINSMNESELILTTPTTELDLNHFDATVNESAQWELKDSDVSDYEKMLVVTNATTQAVRKYYISNKIYTPSWNIQGVSADENQILSYNTSNMNGENRLFVYGTADALQNPRFTTDNNLIEATYLPESTGNQSGTLTLKYGSQSYVYSVYYFKSTASGSDTYSPLNFNVNGISDWEDGNYISQYTNSIHNKYMYLINVSGSAEELGAKTKFNFEDGDCIPAEYTLSKETGAAWNYKLTFSYQGQNFVIYINYTKSDSANMLPEDGKFQVNGQDNLLSSITKVTVDGIDQVRICALEEADVFPWDTLVFDSSDDFNYNVQKNGSQYSLIITKGSQQIASYPLFYEKYKNLSSNNLKVQDEGNYISNVTYTTGGGESILTFTGENAALGDAASFTGTDNEVTLNYEKVDNQNYLGTLTLSYQTQSISYKVKYKQDLRDFDIQKVTETGNFITNLNTDYYYDDDTETAYNVNTMEGLNESLGDTAVYTFTNDLTADSVTLTPVTGNSHYNYKLDVVKNGMTRTLYVLYKQNTKINLLPNYVSYSNQSSSNISLIQVDGVDTVRLLGDTSETDFEACWDTLNFSSALNLTYQIRNGDNGRYLDILADNIAVRSYPIIYEKDMCLNYPIYYLSLTDGDNYIVNKSMYNNTENGNSDSGILIQGENASLGDSPVFTYNNPDVTVSYAKSDNSTYAGTMSLSYKTQKSVFNVKYNQVMRYFDLASVTETGNIITNQSTDYFYDEANAQHRVLSMEGFNESLGDTAAFTFSNDFTADNVILTPVTGDSHYNYKLDVVKNGMTTIFYLLYKQNGQINLLPGYAGTPEGTISYVNLIQVNGVDTVRLMGDQSEDIIELNWDRVVLGSSYGNVNYQIRNTESGRLMDVLIDNICVKSYPIIYEQYMHLDNPCNYITITDGDNYIVGKEYHYDMFGDSESYIDIGGENASFGDNPIIEHENQGVTISYSKSDNSKFDGVMTLSYKTQNSVFNVKYEQVMRNFVIQEVIETGNSIMHINSSNEYDADTNKVYYVYTMDGLNESLGDTATFVFSNDFVADSVVLTPVQGNSVVNYKLDVVKKGLSQTIYLKYTQIK